MTPHTGLTVKKNIKVFYTFFKHFRRYVENATLFSELTSSARQIPSARLAMGGNAPAMARRMAMEGAEILLASRFTEETLKTIPASIKGKKITIITIEVLFF